MEGNKIKPAPLWKKNWNLTTLGLCLCVSNHLLLSQLTTAITRGGSRSQPSVFRGEAKNRHQAELLEESSLRVAQGNDNRCSRGLSEAHMRNELLSVEQNPSCKTKL